MTKEFDLNSVSASNLDPRGAYVLAASEAGVEAITENGSRKEGLTPKEGPRKRRLRSTAASDCPNNRLCCVVARQSESSLKPKFVNFNAL